MIDHATTIRGYLDSGLSIIPIKRDGSKMPMVEWAIYQTRRATEEELDQWISWTVTGWGMVCGAASGNVETIDFDDLPTFIAWLDLVPPELLKQLVIQTTPGNGKHVIYRCAVVEGNLKLARREGDGKPETLIETRGEGGMILVEPTTAEYHPNNKPYQITQGSLLAIPEITEEERAQLFNAARSLNEYWPAPKAWTPTEGAGGNGDGHRPGDDFANNTPWQEILEPHGWRPLYQRGDRIIWQRPGKDGPGGSAQTGGASPKTGFSGLYVYSTNAYPLEAERGYGKFSAYATLNCGGDYSAAARELAAQGWGRQVIIRERAPETAPDNGQPAIAPKTDALSAILDQFDGSGAPALPDAAYLDPALGNGASPWLAAYAELSRAWSPRAFDDFHVACGLWLLSTVAARRVVIHLGGARYSNLYIALVARTSLWAKSTTAKIVTQTLGQCDMGYLLAPDDSTPQRFVSDLVLKVPEGYTSMDGGERAFATMRMAFPASRGWFYEEFGQKIDAMLAPGGFMAEFRGILRAFDDCPETYQYASIGRGMDAVSRPYVAMLGNMTPADLRRATAKHDALWQDGFWARWAFITPPNGVNSSRARFPEGERTIPDALCEPIKAWHKALGVPEVSVEETYDDQGKGSGALRAYATPLKRVEVTMAKEAKEAFYAYHDGLLDIVERSDNRDLDGNYARFAEKALRIALLVAALEHGNHISLAVWALAQGITERWRQSLHELYTQANLPDASELQEKEEKALQIVSHMKEPTASDVGRYMHLSSKETADILDGLVQAGVLARVAQTRRGTARYAVMDEETQDEQ